MSENSDYNPMPAFRDNIESARRECPELFDAPDALRELLEQFIDRADKHEILECMIQIVNTDKKDYDSVAHLFL